MSKAKGSRAERELFHKLWDHGFFVLRAAGSGSTSRPAPDLLASNGRRVLAIECKSIKGTRKYFDEEEIQQLMTFAMGFGAEPWIAMRFDNRGWHFVSVQHLEKSGKNYCISLSSVETHGVTFESLVGLTKDIC